MKTSSYNDFCPEILYVQLENDLTFWSENMEHWHDFHKNEEERNIALCERCLKIC